MIGGRAVEDPTWDYMSARGLTLPVVIPEGNMSLCPVEVGRVDVGGCHDSGPLAS
jgi:hypothetical protein